ncbi:MAG: hypothetical protein QM783_13255 [Phycisphaerales bacterium]
MKKPRSSLKIGRKRRAAGWTLLALGLFVAGVWVASGRWMFCVKLADPYRYYTLNGGHAEMRSWRDTLGWREEMDHPWKIIAFSRGRFDLAWKASRESDANNYALEPGACTYVDLSVLTYFNTKGAPPSRGIWRVTPWPLPLFLWILAALLLRSGILAHRRAMTGNCTKCGYSLTGLATETACPECGANHERRPTPST